ncbi:MAG: sulfotransferase [Candidatus Marinimicrobia bacterium]|nr:sulfotransferase [Candidatus Neomarinimicrobiota bacterium]
MSDLLKTEYKKRRGIYAKDPDEENFILKLNRLLQDSESRQYQDYAIEFPHIFVFGLPRSATTLTSQLISSCFDVGYINNLATRFWLAPVYGIRFAKLVLKKNQYSSFQSDYARTESLSDIHEFGYFWMHWLLKDRMEGITKAKEYEQRIDWSGLKTVLANIQHEFCKVMVYKNIYGSYHVEKLITILNKVIFVYVRRDILDSAVSILQARRKYHSDLNTWWSYAPFEYDRIKELDHWHQIAGQVYYLKRYYDSLKKDFGPDRIIEVDYSKLCHDPISILEEIQLILKQEFDYNLPIVNQPPRSFPFRTYKDRDDEKAIFSKLIDKLAESME